MDVWVGLSGADQPGGSFINRASVCPKDPFYLFIFTSLGAFAVVPVIGEECSGDVTELGSQCGQQDKYITEVCGILFYFLCCHAH